MRVIGRQIGQSFFVQVHGVVESRWAVLSRGVLKGPRISQRVFRVSAGARSLVAGAPPEGEEGVLRLSAVDRCGRKPLPGAHPDLRRALQGGLVARRARRRATSYERARVSPVRRNQRRDSLRGPRTSTFFGALLESQNGYVVASRAQPWKSLAQRRRESGSSIKRRMLESRAIP